ncbi:MAG: tRNA (adenosine(37)-N6)-threonylcarbamoyltransferase complex transferase subunit TsaD [Aeriscardovia sp.]|nr:tRNA (adenosine(37)-N6)-threonylcarbamoyltransferase complex transferase subunit TsaD [Aeriscardovia sp.]
MVLRVLGIESSCDETAAAVSEGERGKRKILSNAVASSMDFHARYGGVIPEIASRAHLEAFAPLVEKALSSAGIFLEDLDAVAVSAGPGLAGCLAVGTSGAKGIALGSGKPLFAINHVVAHLAASEGEFGPIPEGSVGLVVSGGHTTLFELEKFPGEIRVAGSTLDDAAGECFDKVGRLLGLPYPAGAAIDALAKKGDPFAIKVPQGLRGQKDRLFDFSFSGVKTSVARTVEKMRDEGRPLPVEDICASLAESVSEVLSWKAVAACLSFGSKVLVVGGGFSANSQLREKLRAKAAEAGIELRIPSMGLCTDNGAMVSLLGLDLLESGAEPSPMDASIDSSMPLDLASF